MKTDNAKCEVKAELVRDILGCIADKWTLVLIDELEENTLRFSELSRRAVGISQKMLTQTLREMERNGLLIRTVYPEVPPRVEYRLTKIGQTLGAAVCGVWKWTGKNFQAVAEARRRFDTKRATP